MLKKTIKFKSKKIEFLLLEIGNDLIFIISGGDLPHIGAISVGIPRPSLKNPDQLSSTISTYVFTGHKDDIIGNKIANEISKRTEKKVVVIAGIHFNHLSERDIKLVVKKSEVIYRDLIELFLKSK
ncbi:MAG: hypothetical protein A2163_04370 [Actinobacteria bacterium RBG_13_35_12]|nr:MAG: hypothetical protein A2163_04370 [Actinobacteria bacterium RBG_13_35_12]